MEYFDYFMKELCRFLLYNFYNTLNRRQQDLFIEYYTNRHMENLYPVQCDREYMFKNEMLNDYNIEHYIGNKNNREYYFFKLYVINELLYKRVDMETVESCINDITSLLGGIAEISLEPGSVQEKEYTYKSSSVLMGSQYDACILAKLAGEYLDDFIQRQKGIVQDYIREEVRKQVSFDKE